MSYNQNYSYFRPNFTFHPNVPPPTFVRPPYYIPSAPAPQQNDQDFVKSFEKKAPGKAVKQKPDISIFHMREKLRNILMMLEEIKAKENYLSENMATMSDQDWKKAIEYTETKKNEIKKSLPSINNSHLDILRKLIAKRSAKRLRLKRVRLEQKREKEDLIKKSEEKSRKIDENLQKIKDDINKIKQEEEAKLQADMVLKEVLRKKTDAKKCVVKLDALLKLRKARENTARGRGEAVSGREATVFSNNIEKLKAVWSQRLSAYEAEEAELRDKLKQDLSEPPTLAGQQEEQLLENLGKWREILFGNDILPQVDFKGNIADFVAVRSKWDRFVSADGSPLPVGWVLPSKKT
ncbi:uncharacterized protein LOC106129097 [Amyelois transitella]|uniref:uncharacterized protein LOC106129097 n=1 Tax=Amyelois transitella TaxID=680683 RepID=UPI00067D6988|nr:uncharacterized protein LOC106129097 [Amyelois transitella]